MRLDLWLFFTLVAGKLEQAGAVPGQKNANIMLTSTEVPYTIIARGTWDHNIGNNSFSILPVSGQMIPEGRRVPYRQVVSKGLETSSRWIQELKPNPKPWVLPLLSNSWIINIVWVYIALNKTPSIDWVGAVP